jgi:hypothetical protein
MNTPGWRTTNLDPRISTPMDPGDAGVGGERGARIPHAARAAGCLTLARAIGWCSSSRQWRTLERRPHERARMAQRRGGRERVCGARHAQSCQMLLEPLHGLSGGALLP